MQMPEVESPPCRLPARVLAHQTVQPALDAPGELKIGRVNGQDQAILQERAIEPIG